MYRPSHRGSSTGRGIAAAAVVLALIGAAVWYFFLRGGGAGGDRPVPDFSFQLRAVEGQSAEGAVAEGKLTGAVEEIRDVLDAMYLAGFLDPQKWRDGTYPEVIEAFAGQAGRRAGRDLDDLTLGPAFSEVDFMRTAKGRLDVRFLADAEGRPVAAFATSRFRARGELTDGRRLRVVHTGDYLLRPGEAGWRIEGYDVEGELEPVARPTESPS